MYTNTNGTMDKCPDYQSVLIIKVSLLVRCPDFRGLNVCTLIQMGPWTSVLIIKMSLLVRCPDFRGLNVCILIQMGPWTSVLIIKVS